MPVGPVTASVTAGPGGGPGRLGAAGGALEGGSALAGFSAHLVYISDRLGVSCCSTMLGRAAAARESRDISHCASDCVVAVRVSLGR